MNNLFLKDVIKLSDEDIEKGKIALNMGWDGVSHFTRWANSDPNNRNVSYSYYSHYAGKRNFTYIGQLVLGFVQLPINRNRWLLVTAGRITSIANNNTCKHEEIKELKGFLGRLVVEIIKGNKRERYIFNLKKFFDNAKIIEILPNDYEAISFRGLDNVQLPFKTLKQILNSEKHSDYRNALISIKGVYCLTDVKTGKLYIGSAYGVCGIAQRWSDYINSKTGGNNALIELYKNEGEKYFEENFKFTLLEFFGMNTDTDKIIKRETFWKEAFASKRFGYNKN